MKLSNFNSEQTKFINNLVNKAVDNYKQKVKDAIETCLPSHKEIKLCMGNCPVCRFRKELRIDEK